MELLKIMKKSKKNKERRQSKAVKDIFRENSQELSVKISSRSRGYGPATMTLSGCLVPSQEQALEHAIDKFEQMDNLKYYLDLSGVELMTSDSLEQILAMGCRIERASGFMGVLDISPQAEEVFSTLGYRDVLNGLLSRTYYSRIA